MESDKNNLIISNNSGFIFHNDSIFDFIKEEKVNSDVIIIPSGLYLAESFIEELNNNESRSELIKLVKSTIDRHHIFSYVDGKFINNPTVSVW